MSDSQQPSVQRSDNLPPVEKPKRLVITEASLTEPDTRGREPDTTVRRGVDRSQADSEAHRRENGENAGGMVQANSRPVPPYSTNTAVGPAAPQPLPSLGSSNKPVLPSHASFCSACGSSIDPRAMICPRCGVAAAGALNATAAVAALTIRHKSPGVAILCSLFLPGAGQFYVGRTGRGVAFFCAALVSYILIIALIGLILVPIVAIWAAIDANKLANAYNAQLLAGMAPA